MSASAAGVATFGYGPGSNRQSSSQEDGDGPKCLTNASTTPSEIKACARTANVCEVENVLSRSLRNENELLRFQLNDIIAREKNQRIELQRLRSHRDVEVSQMVSAASSQLKAEVDQLKELLQSTSSQLLQALTDKEKIVLEKEHAAQALGEVRQSAAIAEASMKNRLQHLEDVVSHSITMASTLSDFVLGFQRHVLPTFNPSGTEHNNRKTPSDAEGGSSLIDELKRLEGSLSLLRVLVDAKNDTLVLIRGKLKQENEELKAEVEAARERDSKHKMAPQPLAASTGGNDVGFEKTMLRQELHSLQNLFNAEVKQLKAKLKMYETEDRAGHGRFEEVQKELLTLQNKLLALERSRALLETHLKEETSARSQLVSQLFALRKENEMLKTELDTLKLNQKGTIQQIFRRRMFLVRQSRSGRIPVEKMDLMNTMNQLLLEMNKLKGDKVSLEEELKIQRRSQVREHVERTVTARDVAMAASNKVGESELASKLATSRLQHHCDMGNGSLLLSKPVAASHMHAYSSAPVKECNQVCNSVAMINM